MHNIFLISERTEEYRGFSFAAGLLLLLINYIIFEVYDALAQKTEYERKTLLYEQQLELCSHQAEERESRNLEIARLRHDMRNHMTGLLGLIREKDLKAAEAYVQGIMKECVKCRPEDVSRSGNIVVDALVNYKCAVARQEGIGFQANIFLPASIPFQAGHLSIIFGNLLENAIDACREIKEGKRYIELEAFYAKEILTIIVHNTYQGERIQNIRGQYITTKGDTAGHGLGLASVERAVEFYHGQLMVDGENGIFQATVVIYGENREK